MFQKRIDQSKHSMPCRIVSAYICCPFYSFSESSPDQNILAATVSMEQRRQTHSETTRHSGHMHALLAHIASRRQVPMKCERMFRALHSGARLASSVKQHQHHQREWVRAPLLSSAQKEQRTHGPLQKDFMPNIPVQLSRPRVCPGSTHQPFKLPNVMNVHLGRLACLRVCLRLKIAGRACIDRQVMKMATAAFPALRVHGRRIGA